jgi:DtxR family transcriptional regulator, Mn-dependent transcriptional regulator
MRTWAESKELGSAGAPSRAAERTLKLSRTRPGDRSVVVQLQGGDPDRLRRLIALGVMPGSIVETLQGWPARVFRLGHAEFAVDDTLADAIDVRPLQD